MVDYLSDYKKRVFDDKYVGWKILTDGTTNYLRFTVEEELMTKIRNNLNNGQIECKTALFNHPDKKYRIDGNDIIRLFYFLTLDLFKVIFLDLVLQKLVPINQ
jgi:hypothetical protein